MPTLKNQKHEAFAQLTVRGTKYGWSQADIYKRAGFSASGHAAEVSASRLMKKAEVQRRIAELGAPAVKKAQVTVESLLGELEANIVAASVSGQHGAVNGAVALMGKLKGLLIDRAEVGEPGAFAGLKEPDQVIDALADSLIDEKGGNAAAALADITEFLTTIKERIAARAIDITPVAAIEPPRDQVDRFSLSWKRPARKGRR